MLRIHQIIQKVFFLKFSPIFVVQWKEEKYNKKFLVWISETGGGIKNNPPPLKRLKENKKKLKQSDWKDINFSCKHWKTLSSLDLINVLVLQAQWKWMNSEKEKIGDIFFFTLLKCVHSYRLKITHLGLISLIS